MEWEFIAPMVLGVVFFVTTGAVLVLRPLSGRVAELLEVLIKERRAPAAAVQPDVARLLEALESVDDRLARLEDRQDFTDSLLTSGQRSRESVTRGAPRT